MTITAVRLNPADSVLCLLRDHASKEVPVFEGGMGPPVLAPTPLGHKIALQDIAEGEVIRKYGAPIGVATCAIAAGAHVHLHNLRGFLDRSTP